MAVTSVGAFKAGFEFWVSIRYRQADSFAASELAPDQDLHIGLQFADGRKVANFGSGPEPVPGPEPAGLVLRSTGMGGGLRCRNWSYWVWPLPPPGPVAFICEWPEFGITETRADLPGQPILEAARYSAQVWPEENP